VIAKLRSVKSSYELEIVKQAGEIHKRVLEERVPEFLEEGMTEAETCNQAVFRNGGGGDTREYPVFRCLIPKWL